MARIVLEVTVVEDGVRIQPFPYRRTENTVERGRAHQIARELLSTFEHLLQEDPAATAVADVLRQETEFGIHNVEVVAEDPDSVFSKANTSAFWGKRRF